MDSTHRLARRSSVSSSISTTTTNTTKRSSVGSIFAKLGLRSSSSSLSQPTVKTHHHHNHHHVHPTASIPSTVYEDEEGNNRPPQISEDFKRYELLTEFVNLRNPRHCPLGVYVMPSSDSLNVLYGVVFVHKGYYRSGVFKFRMFIPDTYPDNPPAVTFLTDMFHPLVDSQGNVSLSQQFPTWRPHQDYLFHVLHYIKNMFKRNVLEKLVDRHCYNKEAYRLFRNDAPVFRKLSQQCAQLAITETYLYDHFPINNMIRFSPLTEPKFDELKSVIFKSTTSTPDPEPMP